MNRSALITASAILFISTYSLASVRSGCFMENKPDAEIQSVGNTNVDQLQVIASTSKLITSEWALEKLGPNYRFETKFYVERTPGTGEAAVHIQGGYDPYFGSQQLGFVREELRRLGISIVYKVTYDENFKFVLAPRSSPSTNGVIDTKTGWRTGYPTTTRVASELALAGLKKAQFLAAKDFQVTSAMETFSLPSPPLTELLKDMNRLSNNYVANVLFDFLGGPEGFKQRNEEFRTADQYEFLNGSGMWVIENGQKQYNKASCRALIRAIQHSYQIMIDNKMTFEDIAAVDGVYADNQCSTLDGDPNSGKCDKDIVYEVEPLIGAVTAKTGYVNSTVALAGKASAQKAEVFFALIANPGAGRLSIRQILSDLIEQFGGAKKLNYKPIAFSYLKEGQQLVPVKTSQAGSLP